MPRKFFRTIWSQKFRLKLPYLNSLHPPRISCFIPHFHVNQKNGPTIHFCKYIFSMHPMTLIFFESFYMDVSNNLALCLNAMRCLGKFLEHFEAESFVWNCQNRTLHIPQEFNGWLQIWIWTKKTAPPYTFVKIFFSMHPMTPILFRESLYGCK